MINLIIRRAAAFLIDFVLLSIIIAVPCLIFLIAQKDVPATYNLFLLAGVLLYFSISETSESGQTFGKRLLGIRLQTKSGENVSLYQSCARICLLLLLPDFSMLLKDFFVVVHLTEPSGFFLPIFLDVSSRIVLPISIVVGSGRLGLNDFMLGTEVVPLSKQYREFHDKIIRGYPWIAIMSTIGISLVCAYFFVFHLETSMDDTSSRMNRSEKLECERLKNVARDLPLLVRDGPKYMLGNGKFSFNNWDLLKFPDSPVSFSSDKSSEGIYIDDNRIDTYVYYRINVTRKGIWSFKFQNAIVDYIFSNAKRPGLLMSIEFIQDTKALVFCQTIKKRYIGFIPLEVGSEEEKHDLITIEPEAAIKIPGISWSLLIREDL